MYIIHSARSNSYLVRPDSVLQDRVCPGDPSTVGVMTLRDILEQKEVVDSPENRTGGSPGNEEHFIRK